MKKKQRFLFYAIVIVAAITIIGMAAVIFGQKDWTGSTLDIIILITGSISILLAIYSERSSDKERRRLTKMIHDINNIDANLASDMHIDDEMRKKLNHIIAMDEQILEELTSHKRATKRVGKKATEKSKWTSN